MEFQVLSSNQSDIKCRGARGWGVRLLTRRLERSFWCLLKRWSRWELLVLWQQWYCGREGSKAGQEWAASSFLFFTRILFWFSSWFCFSPSYDSGLPFAFIGPIWSLSHKIRRLSPRMVILWMKITTAQVCSTFDEKKTQQSCHCWTVEDGSSSRHMIIVRVKELNQLVGFVTDNLVYDFDWIWFNLVGRLGLTEAILVASWAVFRSSRGRRKWTVIE
jgi:hypothetical protein